MMNAAEFGPAITLSDLTDRKYGIFPGLQATLTSLQAPLICPSALRPDHFPQKPAHRQVFASGNALEADNGNIGIFEI